MNHRAHKTLQILTVLVLLVCLAACSLHIPADPQEHLRVAREFEKTASYRTTLRLYVAFATRYPDSKYTQDAIDKAYEIALEHFDSDTFWAFKRLRILLTELPDSKLADEALSRVYQEALRKWDSTWGNQHLKKLVEDFPAAELAAEATFKIGEYQCKYKEYEEAIATLGFLIRNYPRSERVEAAIFLTGEAHYAQYQGADYESMPLRNADEQYKRLINHFPKGAFVERARKQTGEIRKELARRDYRLALYYRRHGKRGSAKLYLDSVAKEYPDTEYGNKARKMLQAMIEPEK
jgi:outer membrane assembly lipoprotein YfiO